MINFNLYGDKAETTYHQTRRQLEFWRSGCVGSSVQGCFPCVFPRLLCSTSVLHRIWRPGQLHNIRAPNAVYLPL
jgi:hypothetical protein